MFSGCATRRPVDGFLKWPVSNPRLTQNFKMGSGRHFGIDLAAALNTPITAAHAGQVVYAGSGFTGFGKMVLLENKNGWATIYAHLNKFSVKTGQIISQGQLIGLMGRTGRATGVHLHFEVRNNKAPIDPMTILRLKSKTWRMSRVSNN